MASAKITDFTVWKQLISELLNTSVAENEGILANGLGLINKQNIGGGDTVKAQYFNKLAGLVSRRDPSLTTEATPVAQSSSTTNAPVLRRMVGPISSDRDIALQGGPERAAMASNVAKQFSDADLEDKKINMYNALQGSIAKLATTVNSHTVSRIDTTDTFSYALMQVAKTLMGDARPVLKTGLMDSYTFSQLVGDAMNYNALEVVGGTTIVNDVPPQFGLGRIIVDDNLPVEVITDGGVGGDEDGNVHRTYLLGDDVLYYGAQRDLAVEAGEGNINLINPVVITKAYTDYALGVIGMEYTAATNPTSAALATSTNWATAFNNHKEVEVVCVETFEATA